MNPHDKSTSTSSVAYPPSMVAGVITALILTAVSSFAGESGRIDLEMQKAVLPFVWRDIAAVSFLSALPLAWLISEFLFRMLGRLPSMTIGLTLSFVVWLLFINSTDTAAFSAGIHPHGTLLRSFVALMIASGTTLAVQATALRSNLIPTSRDTMGWTGQVLTAVMAFGLIPMVYVNAHCRYNAERVVELHEQSRVGEAKHILDRLLALDVEFDYDGEPIRELLPELNESVDFLNRRVETALQSTASIDDHLERARHLAMLGQVENASAILLATGHSETHVEICELLAIIAENQKQWETALARYLNCQVLWNALPEATRRPEGIYSAMRGTAYCYRKLGRIRQAEDEWLKLLALSPQADTYFLLAQFYEDIQKSTKAQQYAIKAAELSPRYRDKAKSLIKKMQQMHFGCFQLQ
ncbi:MAG: hypothetical protein R3C20_08010 [Planctomycetaceae bacterium]